MQSDPSSPASSGDPVLASPHIGPFPSGDHVRLPSSSSSSEARPLFTFFTDRYYNQFVMRDCKGQQGNNMRVLLHSNLLATICLDPSHPLVARRDALHITHIGHTVIRNPTHNNNNNNGSSNKNSDPAAAIPASNGFQRSFSDMCVQGKKKKNAKQCQKDMVLLFVQAVETKPAAAANTAEEAREEEPVKTTSTVESKNDEVQAPASAAAAAAAVLTSSTATVIHHEFRIPACIDGTILEFNQRLLTHPQLLQRFPLQEGYIAVINPHAKVKFAEMEKVWTCTSGEMNVGDDE